MECLIKTGATWFGYESMLVAQSVERIGCSVTLLAKAGMRRPDPEEPHGTESNKKQKFPKNDVKPVPEISGKAKHGKAKADDKY